jgi:hypothetical protein
MPTTAKGRNVFHASQVMPDSGPNDNVGDDESGGANAGEEWEDNVVGMDENRLSTLPAPEIEADEEHIRWSPSPTPQTPSYSASPCPGPSINYKRKHPAISSGTTSAIGTVTRGLRVMRIAPYSGECYTA